MHIYCIRWTRDLKDTWIFIIQYVQVFYNNLHTVCEGVERPFYDIRNNYQDIKKKTVILIMNSNQWVNENMYMCVCVCEREWEKERGGRGEGEREN